MTHFLKLSNRLLRSPLSKLSFLIWRLRHPRFKKQINGSHNQLKYASADLESVTFDIIGSHNLIDLRKCILRDVHFRIRGDHHTIVIEDGCIFSRGGTIWVEDHNCNLKVGRNTTFQDVHLAITEPYSKIEIGEDCMFAYDIDIRTGDSHSVLCAKSEVRLNYPQNVTIGNHVWVAAHSILLKGVSLGDDSVVATGAVVSHGNYDKGVILGGNPAKIIKRDIKWSRERIA